jgi:hypothetical protein
MKGLEIAIKGYKTEYLSLPYVGATAPVHDNEPYDTTDPNGIALLDILLAKTKAKNPREIRFWEPPPQRSNGSGFVPGRGLVDSWGKQGYKMILDYDGDGEITLPAEASSDFEPAVVNADVILYSAGADRNFAGSRDNVRSWQ